MVYGVNDQTISENLEGGGSLLADLLMLTFHTLSELCCEQAALFHDLTLKNL